MNKCKHCLNTEINEIGETICFCEEYGEPVNVTQGDCFGNCEMEEAELKGENNEKQFEGYWGLWLYRWKTYLSSVSRYTQNKRLKEKKYTGD